MMAMQASSSSTRFEALLTSAHVWCLRPSGLSDPRLRDRWLARLSADERARYGQLRTPDVRANHLAARVLCRATLSRYAGINPWAWRFTAGPNGKPEIAEPQCFREMRFNIAHADGLAVCIVTRAGEAGVDAEETSQSVDASLVARHFLSAEQIQTSAALSGRAGFYEQWVLKEAYVKATAQGLACAPERLTIEQRADGLPVNTKDCQFSLHRPSANHVAAAAVLRRTQDSIVSFEWLVADIRE